MAALGSTVVLTDRHDATRVLANLRSSLLTNNPTHFQRGEEIFPIFLQASVVGFSYGLFSSQIISLGPFDVIMGADLFYDNVKGVSSFEHNFLQFRL